MCVVSMVGDHYADKYDRDYPNIWKTYPMHPTAIRPDITKVTQFVTKEEFEALKKDVLEMKELLKRAKEYDERNNEPDCEVEDKMEKLRTIASLVGIDLDDVLGGEGK